MRLLTRLKSFNPLGFERSSPRRPGEPPKLAIVTCIKNEGEDLVEWLCFHRQIGVSRFVIYDNESTDATARILEAVPFRDEITVHPTSRKPPQKLALEDAVRRYRQSLDWVAFLDGDEYIVPLDAIPLDEKLSAWEDAGVDGVGIHWRVFGSSGHATRPVGLLTESFTRRAPDDTLLNQHVKTIARMARIKRMVTSHYFAVKGDYTMDDGTKPPRGFRGVAPRATFEQGVAIHHYVTKSRSQCMTKIARGRPLFDKSGQQFREASYFEIHDRNEIEDDRAAQIIAPIRDRVLKLRDEIGRG